MFQERVQQVKDKIQSITQAYKDKHPNRIIPVTDIRFDLRGRCAGQAGRIRGQWVMRFNRDMMVNQSWDHLINDTVPHELAHIVCMANNLDRGHGYMWAMTCRELGGNGQRCHTEEVTYAKGNTYVYTTSTGKTYNVSQVKHRRIQQGNGYTFKDRSLGRLDKTCAYRLLGSNTVVTPTVSPKEVPVKSLINWPAVPTPTVKAPGATNAELVRARIAQAKARNEMPDVVAQWAVDCLGMKIALARAYVKNNWSRV